MATKKGKERATSGEGKPAKAPAEPRGAKRKSADPSVTSFLKKLGGAPTAKGRATPAKGLLGDIAREDLIRAGRLGREGDAPPDPFDVDDSRARVHVEVSSPGARAAARSEERAPFAAHVEVRSVFSTQAKKTRSVNLSVGGVFVETTDVLEVGDPVMLSFAAPDGTSFTVSGRVRWVTPFGGVDDAVPGMGISFVGLDESKRIRLERVLRSLPRTVGAAGAGAPRP